MTRNVNPETGNIELPKDELGLVAQLADELASVRQLCATYGPPCTLEGELRLKWLGQRELGAKLIEQGYELARYYAPACYAAGELAAEEDDLDRAAELLNRSVALQPSYFRNTMGYYLRELKRPDLARELAGDDYRRIQFLASVCARMEEYADLADGYRSEAVEALRELANSGEANYRDLANLAGIESGIGNFDQAVELYRQALISDHANVGWRIAMADALAASGRTQEAIAEARTCLRFRPQWNRAIRLIERLSVEQTPED